MKFRLTNCLVLLNLFFLSHGFAQAPPRSDTSRPAGPGVSRPAPTGPRPYSEIITSRAVTDNGLFKVHKVEDKYYFEIPDSLMNREILVVNRVSKAPAGLPPGGLSYAGDQISQKVIRFTKGPGNRIFLRTVSYADYAKDSTSPMFISVSNSNMQPIAASFDIKAFSRDSASCVVDMTELLTGDNEIFFLTGSVKTSIRAAALQTDKSYMVSVKSFPVNIEIVAVKTFARSPTPGSVASQGANITMELNSSLLLLPKVPMQGRYRDPRVGFFDVGYNDYDLNPQGIKKVSLIKRWRLEPKAADLEKYKRGELVEPAHPIVFYIDPSTPEKWIPYLIQGVNDWAKAFEKAGFKNAIMGKRAPTKEENPEWSLEDARHSAIVYKPSTTPNASGPSIADPRSGEIIESHINWYHNVMMLLRNWYFVQAAPFDPRARKMIFDDSLMGQLIRFVSSHEVGHTLGLRHNFGSSSSVPVDSLRKKAWVEKYGHTPSIMDYARFNYVAQPEDKIGDDGIFPRIGDYDEWAIEWGYRRFPEFDDPDKEKTLLNKWVIEKLKNKRLWFGDGEFYRDDPRSLTEQVGDDPTKAGYYGIKNLQRIVPNLKEWTREPNEDYSNLNMMYNEVVNQFKRYNNHVIARVGGLMLTFKTVEQSGPVYEYETRIRQKEAVIYLDKYVFQTQNWLIDKEIFSKTGQGGLKVMGDIQGNALNNVLKRNKLNMLVKSVAAGERNPYLISEFLSDMKMGVWSELSRRQPIDIYRRQLQQLYINRIDFLLNSKNEAPTNSLAELLSWAMEAAEPDLVDVTAALRQHLLVLRNEINASLPGMTEQATTTHLREMIRRIDKALKPDK
ncbi:MAG TPA: zinc-dependent metalloprotease [Lacibacter sp.]|nr:zinc-dependent metalloprotease [Lacibacter sp.]HMO88031.1 zinc-dependent metalloprotease [Lacibacter sp.]HMP85901.1 zinc-dependent metalloprotease [Lacibacter sp.]